MGDCFALSVCTRTKSSQSCPPRHNPMDCSPPGSSVHGILQARILEWVIISFSRRSSQLRNQTTSLKSLVLAGVFFTTSAIWRRRRRHPTPVLLPGKSRGQGSLVGCSPWGCSRTRLSDFTFTFHFHALEKEMATHSSVLAQRIPGTGEPGRLPSMGSHRVGHD